MARTVIVTFGCVAIMVACVDDSITAGTLTANDDSASAADNDYFLDQSTTPQLVERELRFFSPLGSISISLETPRCAAEAAATAHFGFRSPDVLPLIMQC